MEFDLYLVLDLKLDMYLVLKLEARMEFGTKT